MRWLLGSIIFSCALLYLESKLGVDLIKPLSVEEWTALNADFAVVRVINEDGTIDGTGIRNLRAALEANMTELSGYMYPCVQSSYYARVQGVTCLDPAEQIEALVKALEKCGGTRELCHTYLGPYFCADSFTYTYSATYIRPHGSAISVTDHRCDAFANFCTYFEAYVKTYINTYCSVVRLDCSPYNVANYGGSYVLSYYSSDVLTTPYVAANKCPWTRCIGGAPYLPDGGRRVSPSLLRP